MMASALPDRIVLGHNNFFGVDHLSASRGAQRAAHFSRPERIMEMVRQARELGAGGMMMSTHERSQPVAQALAADPELRRDFRLYPLLPYAQKYVTRANEVGMINLVWESLSGGGMGRGMGMIFQGAKGVLSRDVNSILGALIRLELKHFEKLAMQVIFLHDVFTDLALGLALPEIIDFYLQEIPRLYGCRGGLATKNLPGLLERFQQWGLEAPPILTHFNRAGYHMNPDRAACEEAAARHRPELMAMGTLASGYLSPEEAYSYLAGVAGVRSVVVGASSPEHARETFGAVKRHLG
jgi:hypothetical protein